MRPATPSSPASRRAPCWRRGSASPARSPFDPARMSAAVRAHIEAVGARFAWWSITVGRPAGSDWLEVSSLADDTLIGTIYARMLYNANGRADVAAVHAAAMTSILVEPLVSSIVVDRRAWALDAGHQWVRFDREGFVA